MLNIPPLSTIPVDKLDLPHSSITVDVLRLDLLHPVVSGNKWFKLKLYVEEARALGKTTVVSFGGAWSNHIVATAAACQSYGLKCIGVIRGEEPSAYSATLLAAASYGMRLFFTSRREYQRKIFDNEITGLIHSNKAYVINEGGYGMKGMLGASQILTSLETNIRANPENPDSIIVAVGTGTTLAGLVYAASPGQQLIGVSVLKNHHDLSSAVNDLLPAHKKNSFEIMHNFHFGGYARASAELFNFMNSWYDQQNIPSDFVYTGKLFYAVDQLHRKGFFRAGSKVLVIHTGGLQGNASLPKGTLIF